MTVVADRRSASPHVPSVRCGYFVSGACRSCTLIETPYPDQLTAKQARCRELLPAVAEETWLPAVPGGVRAFRNRAKLAVGGRAGGVTLGILGRDGSGVDLRACLIQGPAIHDAIPAIAEILNKTGLAPYDVPARRGELKYVHVTEAPSGELMIRFVVRTQEGLGRLRARVSALRAAVPTAVVITVNLLPEHRAVLEGEEEIVLHGESLPMALGAVTLHLQPRSFFQTNTSVARALYAQIAEWVAAIDPGSLWDLYCGVGGFALHCTAPGREVRGVELSASAIEAAERSAREAGLDATFVASDATAYALEREDEAPELVVVNPPRRGIGVELAEWLQRSVRIRSVVYSSCNPESLARDLALMPGFVVRSARLFDMFPHTGHLEVAVLLERCDPEPAAQGSAAGRPSSIS